MSGAGPWDELHLWWLGRPRTPVPIGVLRFVAASRGVSLQYHESWLARGPIDGASGSSGCSIGQRVSP